MYLDISPNKGSVVNYINYLNKEQEFSYESFFNQKQDEISEDEITANIDRKGMKLKKDEAKFYALNICPSKEELAHIGSDTDKLKEYTRIVMDEYAKNFKRKGITKDSLVWYAKVEHSRGKVKFKNKFLQHNKKCNNYVAELKRAERYKDFKAIETYTALLRDMGGFYCIDKETGAIEKLQDHKKGFVKLHKDTADAFLSKTGNTHIHVMVSRKDVTNKISLSPMAKGKEVTTYLRGKAVQTGFNRKAFAVKSEKRFDLKFDYNRPVEKSVLSYFHSDNPYVQYQVNAYYDKMIKEEALLEKNSLFRFLKKIETGISNTKKLESKLYYRLGLNDKKVLMALSTLGGGGVHQSAALLSILGKFKDTHEKTLNYYTVQAENLKPKETITKKNVDVKSTQAQPIDEFNAKVNYLKELKNELKKIKLATKNVDVKSAQAQLIDDLNAKVQKIENEFNAKVNYLKELKNELKKIKLATKNVDVKSAQAQLIDDLNAKAQKIENELIPFKRLQFDNFFPNVNQPEVTEVKQKFNLSISSFLKMKGIDIPLPQMQMLKYALSQGNNLMKL